MRTKSMLLKPTNILVVCFGNAIENPGPSRFATELAETLHPEFRMDYFGTYLNKKPEDVQVWGQYIKTNSVTSPNTLIRIYKRYLNFKILLPLMRTVRARHIQIVNVHNLNLQIPLIMYPLLRLKKKIIITTLHDYTAIYNRKLYKSDVKNLQHKSMRTITNHKADSLTLNINRYLFNLSHELIYLSEMQKKIFQQFGFINGKVINNKIKECRCPIDVINVTRSQEKKVILFIGRSIGKGLEGLISWISSQDTFKLELVGKPELKELAAHHLDQQQFHFCGELSPQRVAKKIHKSALVYAASECLDVYPTTVLEAIVHGTPVIVSNNCGNADLVESIDKRLVNENLDQITPAQLSSWINTWQKSNNLRRVQKKVTNTEENSFEYKQIFDHWLVHFKTKRPSNNK